MSTTSTTTPALGATAAQAADAPKRSLPRLYLLEAKYEFLKLWRLRGYSVSTLVFPLMFYLIFGSTFGRFSTQGIRVAAYMLASYAAVGVINAAVFAFGSGVASERAQGWMMLKRVSPMPPAAYFAGKTVMAMLFSALVLLVLTLAAYVLQGVHLALGTWLELLGVMVGGVLPFAALGLMFGYSLGPNSAPAVLNLVNLPMAFASGLYIPIEQLPPFIQHIAPYLPAYHFAQLALSAIHARPIGTPVHHLVVLAAFTAAFLIVAVRAYRRDEGRTYG